MTRYSRTEWEARPTNGDHDLDESDVLGIALHYPAMTKPVETVQHAKAVLRSIQRYHMDDQGWSDIAYQEAVDQAGNSYMLRGFLNRSAANGDGETNRDYGALLLLVANDEKPTEALIETARRRIARFRRIYPDGTAIVGHGQIRPHPTACPGKSVQAVIDKGAFNPSRPARPAKGKPDLGWSK